MTVNKFEKIRQTIHFNDNNLNSMGPNRDKLFKIRPVIETLRKRFLTVPLEENLSVDEQLCSTKARSALKVYLPNKPHKWGYKLCVLCGVSGFAYNFEVCSGQENQECFCLEKEPDLGASSNIVVRLCRVIPKNENFKVFFDNYYTSLPLLVYLKRQAIYSLGTVRRNRLKNVKLPSDEVLKKNPRETIGSCVTKVRGTDITAVVWKDTKVVNLLSTFVGADPVMKVKRFDKKLKKHVEVDCPAIIKTYNKHMGGVDLLDGLLGRHKIKTRSRKWYIRLFYHMLDVTIVNSWLLHRRIQEGKGENKTLTLVQFRKELAISLCKVGQVTTPKRGRPSKEIQDNIEKKRKLGTKKGEVAPTKDIRLDGIQHWPIDRTTKTRCKMPGCDSYTWIKCSKCDISLCCGKSRVCFTNYHTK